MGAGSLFLGLVGFVIKLATIQHPPMSGMLDVAKAMLSEVTVTCSRSSYKLGCFQQGTIKLGKIRRPDKLPKWATHGNEL